MSNPRSVPPQGRFRLGVFIDVEQAERTLQQAMVLSEINRSALRACGIVLNGEEYGGEGVNEYAQSVMADQTVTLRDIEDIKAVIAEMRELEEMMGDIDD